MPSTIARLLSSATFLALVLAGCGGDDTGDTAASASTSTTEPASQYGSSMGVTPGDVADVAALGDGPAAGEVWEVPVGLSVCGRFVDLPAGAPEGGVTAGAFSATVEGGGEATPTVGDLAGSAGMELGAGRLTLPEGIVPPELDNTDPPTPIAGASFASGDLCGQTPGEVQVWVYSEDARRTGDGILVVTQDPGNVPFVQENMAIVIAFAPESSLPTLPPSALTTG